VAARNRWVAPDLPVWSIVAAQRDLSPLASRPEIALVFSEREIAFAALERLIGAPVRFAIVHRLDLLRAVSTNEAASGWPHRPR
jgi:hypothetical protein